jgi:hypothetical protein
MQLLAALLEWCAPDSAAPDLTVAFVAGPDRDELLRAALRSHEDGLSMPLPTTAAHLNSG